MQIEQALLAVRSRPSRQVAVKHNWRVTVSANGSIATPLGPSGSRPGEAAQGRLQPPAPSVVGHEATFDAPAKIVNNTQHADAESQCRKLRVSTVH
jgi:hypothetical protein